MTDQRKSAFVLVLILTYLYSMNKILGKQRMLELYGCKKELLNDIAFIKKTMLEAAKIAKATIVQQYFHQFSPYGVSGTVIIAESHINIHTWPEHDYAAIDIFTCSEDMDVDSACTFLKKALKAKQHDIKDYKRGNLEMIKKVRDLQTQHRHQ